MNDLYLLLGSNLGDRFLNIAKATGFISVEIGLVKAASGLYETEPWGNVNQGKFLNQILKLSSKEDPELVLQKILSIELKMGRKRNKEQNSARIIDIDILFYGGLVFESAMLSIPHPRIQLRRFVLVPLNEIAPGLIHPVSGKSMQQLLRCCPDKLEVLPFGTFVNSL
ncbi:MAG: 2-amino-4-hydroxy-6-hydroxymethyldihydropteridine diphosphokinase [Lentimicrobium sp.]